MGFGLCTFGYSLLIFFLFGGDTAGYILLGIGLKKLGKYDKRFRYASYFSFALIGAALIRLVGFVNGYLDFYEKNGNIEIVLQWIQAFVFVLCSLAMHYLYYNAVIKIVKSGGDDKFVRLATFMKYLSLTVFVAYGFAASFGQQIMSIVWIAIFALIVLNTFFLFKCYASITTESRLEDEKKEFGIPGASDDDDDD